MDPHRQTWAQRQQQVRRLLLSPEQYSEALSLWLRQHAHLHAAALTGTIDGDGWSFEDEVVAGLTEAQMRTPAAPGNHSIAWIIWHIARIEDVTMNLLVAGRPQVLEEGRWPRRLGVAQRDVGTAMQDVDVAEVSARIDVAALRAYRLAVGRRTQEIVRDLPPAALRQKVSPERLRGLRQAGALREGAALLAETWGGWTTLRFLMMPATRHSFTHLNAARRLAERIRRQR